MDHHNASSVSERQRAIHNMQRKQELVMKILLIVLPIQLVVIVGGVAGVSSQQSVVSGNVGSGIARLAALQVEGNPKGKSAPPASRAAEEVAAAKPKKAYDPFEGQGQSNMLNPAEAAWLDAKEIKTFKALGIE